MVLLRKIRRHRDPRRSHHAVAVRVTAGLRFAGLPVRQFLRRRGEDAGTHRRRKARSGSVPGGHAGGETR